MIPKAAVGGQIPVEILDHDGVKGRHGGEMEREG
jgi:hypothetical protein